MAVNTQTYRDEMDAKRILQIREILRELPQACGDYIRSIAVTTGTFTRLAYAMDLRTFFQFLHQERLNFSKKPITQLEDADLNQLSRSDMTAYTEYLTYYFKNPETSSEPNKALVNHELAIKRKLCSIRSFYDYLFQEQRVTANVTELVPLPKVHEKPIIRLSADEMEAMLSQAQTGTQMTSGQQRFQKLTGKRDFAILSLFLGTGIRVSECVGNYLEERKAVEALPGHEQAAFLSLQRRRITQRAIQNLVKKYAAYAAPLKPKLSPHKLRSTYATNLYQETGDIYLVADVLGHSSVDTTRKHYADMTDARRRMAADHVHLPGDPAFQSEKRKDSSES